jgi:hypothetical protein
VKSSLFGTSTREDKVVTTIDEYHWDYTSRYELLVYAGSDPAKEDR